MAKHKYTPLFLSTQQLLSQYWEEVAELIVGAPVMEELSSQYILDKALAGQMFVFVVFDADGKLVFVLICSPSPTPNLDIMNIVTVAGSELLGVHRELWAMFKGWCFMNGVRAIDAYVPDERFEAFMGRLGFARESIHVRTIL